MSRLKERRDARDGLVMPRVGGGGRPLTAAVDLGASKVACFIMKPDGVNRAAGTVQVAGAGYVQSRGVRGGAIVNMEEAAQAIAQAVERAEAMAGVSVSSVTVSTAGGQLASRRVQAQVGLGARPIGEAECSRAIQLALAQAKMPGRRPIHLLPVSWSVDGAKGVRDPRAMFGKSLILDLLVVSMNESAFHTLSHCLELAHLSLDGAVAAPFAAGLAALEEDEMELGAVCIDLGGGATSVGVFGGGALRHVDSLPVGGIRVTNDIAVGLSTTTAGAERIKTLHGSAIASAKDDRELIEAPHRGGDQGAGPHFADRSMLTGIIAPRIEETLEMVRDRLKAARAPIEPGAGVVLTGGASQLAGVREVAIRVFDRPVRLGRPRRAPHLAEAAAGPAFCAAAGVLQRAAFGPREAVPAKLLAGARGPREAAEAPAGALGGMVAWLRENL
jgi:cell division protein FtsA